MRSSPPEESLRAGVALAETEGLGPIRIGRLVAAFGGPEAALMAGPEAWAATLAVGEPHAAGLRARAAAKRDEEADRVIEAQRALGARGIVVGDKAYPSLLATIPDPPPVLWIRGDWREEDEHALAVVGARRCTAYGLDQAARFSVAASERGYTIVSGGARGIDGEAHRAALRAGGRTIAVLGSGLGRPYPPEHASLFDAIADGQGAVVSEFAADTEPRPEFFPRRNRIVSGLSLAVLVIEARERSGAAITARLAVEDHGREALALPGRADSSASSGCHRAIREGWAALVAHPDHLFESLGGARSLLRGARESCGQPAIRLDPASRRIAAQLVAQGPLTIEDLAASEPIGGLLAALTCLEIQGLIRRGERGGYEARRELRDLVEREVPDGHEGS